MKYYVGSDLGGMSMKIGVVDENYNIIATAKHDTNVAGGAETIAADMAKTILEAVQKSGLTLEQMEYIGIGSPGTVNKSTGCIEYSNNLRFYNAPFASYIEKALGKKVYMDNDANAAALGEALAGAGNGSKNVICITLGTGVGSGIIIDGKIFAGTNYAGGEFGHSVIVYGGRPCTCGRNGCFEAYASATGLIKLTRETMEANKESVMWDICEGKVENANGKTAFDAMRAGDASGKAVVDEYLNYLGCGITNVINIFQPEVLCIGGGISKEGDTLLNPVKEYVERECFTTEFTTPKPKIVIAKLGNDAGIIGAAMLGRADK
ncbi:ROK family protein [Hydrogenoanaerobacterium sp.]|uniref:ROK family protein n=1 Tax=Hydrogenoanaerobacterium sp. TaxID=2953763 RepID=UPI002898FF96|nr:ROK family protein [Hydrogenoanaerobacterium sp.]